MRVQGGTRRHRRKRRRGSGDGARGQQRVGVGMDGWDGSGVFTHRVLRVDERPHLHQRVDERRSTSSCRPVKQRVLALQTHTRGEVKGERGGAAVESLTPSASSSRTTAASNWALASRSPPSFFFLMPSMATTNCSQTQFDEGGGDGGGDCEMLATTTTMVYGNGEFIRRKEVGREEVETENDTA